MIAHQIATQLSASFCILSQSAPRGWSRRSLACACIHADMHIAQQRRATWIVASLCAHNGNAVAADLSNERALHRLAQSAVMLTNASAMMPFMIITGHHMEQVHNYRHCGTVVALAYFSSQHKHNQIGQHQAGEA